MAPPHGGLERLPERLHDPVAGTGREGACPSGDLGDAALKLLEREVAKGVGCVAEPMRERLDRRRLPAGRVCGEIAVDVILESEITRATWRPESSGSITLLQWRRASLLVRKAPPDRRLPSRS